MVLEDISSEILQTADSLIHGDRREDYGDPGESFKRIAQEWAQHLAMRDGEGEMAPADVALMMARLKLVRAAQCPQHLDSYVDAAAYIALAGELAGARKA